MSTVVEIKKAIETLPPGEREKLAQWLLVSGKTPSAQNSAIHPDVLKITGLVSENVEAEVEHRQHLLQKHK